MGIAIEELNATNCKTYLLTSGGECALIDPVRERVATYLAVIAARGTRLSFVLETHMHADHLMLNRGAKEALGAPVFMHRKSPSPLVDRHLEDGDVLTLGDGSLRVLATPGHTPDSLCFVTEGAVFTGDTLLIGGSGRTDFPGGDAAAQYDAVTQRLFSLPGGTRVFPAHDYKGHTSSTIAEERATNPRFTSRTREEYVALMGSLHLPFPEKIQKALQVNQSGFEEDEVSFAAVCDVAALPEVSPAELRAHLDSPRPPVLLDVREPEEFTGELGHIRGSILVPLDALEHRLPKLAGYVERELVVVCRAGARSASAGAILRRAGFHRVSNLAGGMLAWLSAGQPAEH